MSRQVDDGDDIHIHDYDVHDAIKCCRLPLPCRPSLPCLLPPALPHALSVQQQLLLIPLRLLVMLTPDCILFAAYCDRYWYNALRCYCHRDCH